MQTFDLDKLCADAMKRLTEHINRSAGQHKRAIRKAFAALRTERERHHVAHG